MAFFNFVGGPGRGATSSVGRSAITERLSDVARRCGDLSPLREPIRRILVEGNKVARLAGVDAQGRPFAPLKASTVRRRRGYGRPILRSQGPPLAPRYAGSRVIHDYVVDVQAGPGRLNFTGSWPGDPWMIYHHTGTRNMPRRDPYGFSTATIDTIRPMLADYVLKRGWWR